MNLLEASANVNNWICDSVNSLQELKDIEGFSSWIAEKVALKNDSSEVQSIAYKVTNIAILETAHHVFNI